MEPGSDDAQSLLRSFRPAVIGGAVRYYRGDLSPRTLTSMLANGRFFASFSYENKENCQGSESSSLLRRLAFFEKGSQFSRIPTSIPNRFPGTGQSPTTSQRWSCLPSSQADQFIILRLRQLQQDVSLSQRPTKGVPAADVSSSIRSALCVLKRASCSRPRRRCARPGQRPVRRRPSGCRRGSRPWRKPCPSSCAAPSEG